MKTRFIAFTISASIGAALLAIFPPSACAGGNCGECRVSYPGGSTAGRISYLDGRCVQCDGRVGR